jgi:hypothetical protein
MIWSAVNVYRRHIISTPPVDLTRTFASDVAASKGLHVSVIPV